MCLNCGCGLPEERHKAGDITLADLKKAAANHDMSVEAAAENMTAAMGDLKKAGRI